MDDYNDNEDRDYLGDLRQKYSHLKTAREVKRTVKEIKDIFNKSGESFNDGDEKLMLKEPPQMPAFPMIIFMVAVFKDLLDVPGAFAELSIILSIIAIIFTTILSFFASIMMFVWCWGKLGGGWWKKILIRWLWIWLIGAMVIEYLPFFKIIPANTIFIYMAYHKEKKIVQLFNLALEKMKKAGLLK